MKFVKLISRRGMLEMAKKHRTDIVTASFHYILKDLADPKIKGNRNICAFNDVEFEKVLHRLRNTAALDENDDDVIKRIKSGQDLPFNFFSEPSPGLYFGSFDAAYYGQQYRNNRVGTITADSLNLREFYYLLTRLRDGRIVIGVTYHGNFGDYDGFRSCLAHILKGKHVTRSRTVTSLRTTLAEGTPTELVLYYRKKSSRPERGNVFARTGAIAIKASEFGDDFAEQVADLDAKTKGTTSQKQKALAAIVKEGDVLELDEDDIIGCQAVVRVNGLTRTVYFLGGSDHATRFSLNVTPSVTTGLPKREDVEEKMIELFRKTVLPLIA